MEDAHAHVLSLGEESSQGGKTSFFAVYDGHGGQSLLQSSSASSSARLVSSCPSPSPRLTIAPRYDHTTGSTVARFAGDTVHERLAQNDAFKKRDFEAAMKRAFLETDEDLRASELFTRDSISEVARQTARES